MKKMRITIETESYNPRRDSKPWVCKITDWRVGASRPEIAWGAWVGRPGNAGELVIEAEAGDLLRYGQNDLRRSNHTYRQYVKVETDGSLTELSDREAMNYWQVERLEAKAEPQNELETVSDRELADELMRRGFTGPATAILEALEEAEDYAEENWGRALTTGRAIEDQVARTEAPSAEAQLAQMADAFEAQN